MTSVQVEGQGFAPYKVHVGRGLLAESGQRLAALGARRVAVVSDTNVAPLYATAAMSAVAAAGLGVDLATVPAGEGSKSFNGLERLLDQLLALGLDRSGVVLALGGGVVGDLAGLAAALFMRGIDIVQAPTTLLAQVDSSVGGKTAIDTPRGKNLVGAFHHPRLVLADIDTLATLPARQFKSGWAEVLKHGLIADAGYFDWLTGEGAAALAGDRDALAEAVVRSVRIKAQVVGDDPKEAGRRALLNLGHTFGHALEAATGFDEAVLTHGEAVAIGCCLAFRFSSRAGLCAAEDAARVAGAFHQAGLPTRLPRGLIASVLADWMAGDKKAEDGRLTLVLADGVGRARVVRDVDRPAIEAFLRAEGAA